MKNDYSVKLKVTHGVQQGGVLGTKYNKSFEIILKLNGEDNFYQGIARYLVKTGLLSNNRGKLEAEILEVRNGKEKLDLRNLEYKSVGIPVGELIRARKMLEQKTLSNSSRNFLKLFQH